MLFPFEKYHGAGNDFIIVRREVLLPEMGTIEAVVRAVCDRHYGVGADGFFLVKKVVDGRCRLAFYNSDGSKAAMCGNGARCVSAYLFAHLGRDRLWLEIGAKRVESVLLPSGEISIRMPVEAWVEWLPAEGGYLLDTGVPHLVMGCESIAALHSLDLEAVARPLRYSVVGDGNGVNVDFYAYKAGHLVMRTYERGVEGETLACGTGAVAVALIAAAVYNIPSPVAVYPPGGRLRVRFERVVNAEGELSYREVFLEGWAVRIARGEFFLPKKIKKKGTRREV